MSVIAVSGTIAFFIYQAYARSYDALQNRFGQSLQGIVATAALQIDGDAHRKLQTRADASLPEFRQIRDTLKRVQEANGLRIDLIYTFNFDEGRHLRFAVMLQEPYTGDAYTIVPENAGRVEEMLQTGKATYTHLYEDQHGIWVSAYAPIFDRQGAISGILEADYEISRFKEALLQEQWWLFECSLIALGLAVLGSLLMVRRIIGALQKIREGAEAIARENYHHRIELRRKDELGLVARQFNRTAEILLERFHLLKFLPRHTVEAVSKRAARGEGVGTEPIEATIFFSDIRGYTSMSETLSDEKVVAMLNTYLSRQAELLQERGGTIDKFIGDAVLAVFTGEHHQRRAVDAATAIQRAVFRMNEEKVFEREVHIGIGLACGRLVLGEIGSEERRERTIIGSVVNLASRLCSQAGTGEILLSGELQKKLDGQIPLLGERRLELKGFTGEQLCYSVDPGFFPSRRE